MPPPTVRKRPRARNHDGTWRKKRADAGKKRGKMKNKAQFENATQSLMNCDDREHIRRFLCSFAIWRWASSAE